MWAFVHALADRAAVFYSPTQFAIWRIVFGVYLAVHFVRLLPYAPEVFGRTGMMAEARYAFSNGIFPNVLSLADSSGGVTLFIVVLAALSVFYSCGVLRRAASLFLWYGWACLLNANILAGDISVHYVGWLLLASTIIPTGEPLSIGSRRQRARADWKMPGIIFYGAWIVLALGYTISGFQKMGSPSWIDGTAFFQILASGAGRDSWIVDWILQFPVWIFQIFTWGVLALEAGFAPLCLWRKTRRLVWLAMTCFHFGILLLLNLTDLTIGLFLFHLFVFDARWVSGFNMARLTQLQTVLRFPAACAGVRRYWVLFRGLF